MNLCDSSLFVSLKGVLKDRKVDSIDEIDEAITEIWNGLGVDDV
jgi:hypothetical protein